MKVIKEEETKKQLKRLNRMSKFIETNPNITFGVNQRRLSQDPINDKNYKELTNKGYYQNVFSPEPSQSTQCLPSLGNQNAKKSEYLSGLALKNNGSQ